LHPDPNKSADLPPRSTGSNLPHLPPHPDLSICIVTFQARDLLNECLVSIQEQTRKHYEVIIVDNGSQDGTIEMLRQSFPQVKIIQNQQNLGYTRPMNQALRLGQGRYLLQLNPDTKVLDSALDRLVDFMDENPNIGICGPKVLNRDGSLQKPCRRGEPRPLAVIAYFTGLANRFPQNQRLGEYLMSYMDEDEIHPVKSVSGSCMVIRKGVVDQIGFLNEIYFAYQEDADFCFQARQAGWQVVYYPKAQIVHYGGMGGSRVQPYRSIFEWHRSYYLYYKSNLARDYFFLGNWLFYLVMLVKLGLALLTNSLRKDKYAGSRKP
jgi:GT2 family glycosyltransferase